MTTFALITSITFNIVFADTTATTFHLCTS
jgi:hypothetical protein